MKKIAFLLYRKYKPFNAHSYVIKHYKEGFKLFHFSFSIHYKTKIVNCDPLKSLYNQSYIYVKKGYTPFLKFSIPYCYFHVKLFWSYDVLKFMVNIVSDKIHLQFEMLAYVNYNITYYLFLTPVPLSVTWLYYIVVSNY